MSEKYARFINYIVDDLIIHTTIDKEFDFLDFDFVSLEYDDADRCDIPMPYLKAKYETLKSYDETSVTFIKLFREILDNNYGVVKDNEVSLIYDAWVKKVQTL
jgi:hypothetical protein